ncbi:MAG: ABC transporter ATP-binding protein [Actinobacteria bacterium]|nr:ABC transporter ATP-binding protein [Actinomycetota bacterium]
MLKRLLTHTLAPYKRVLWLVVLLQGIQSFAGLALPTLNADIIDKGVRLGDQGYIVRMGATMLVVSLVQVAFSIGGVYFGSRAAMGFGRDARANLFRRVNQFSASDVGTFGAPSLITRITNDVQQVQMLVLMACTLLVGAPFTAVGGIVLAAHLDLGLSWIFLVAVPVLLVCLGSIIVRMVPAFRAMQERIDRVNGVLREQLTGIRVVRAFVREPEEKARFDEGNRLLTDTALRGGRLMALMFPTVTLLVNVSSVAVVWFGANRIVSGDMQVGSLVAYLTYLTQILMSVMLATYIGALLPRASVSAERIMEVLDASPSVEPPSHPVSPAAGRAALEFRGVGFSYPGAEEPVLRDLTVSVSAGETLAIVGSTGSGKTTVCNLVARLFDVTEGAVSINGVDVRDLDPSQLWSRIGLVPQKPYLFAGTVASNLRFGKPDATDDELWAALRVAQAEDFVRAMDGGLEATIVQGGANVSGGQRQRLSIARALIHKPEIYLFDDSFSALDLATDARLRAALAPWLADAITVVVAQRISTIRGADRILVLEDGLTVGLGTHDELLAGCATYREIVESQATAHDVAGSVMVETARPGAAVPT